MSSFLTNQQLGMKFEDKIHNFLSRTKRNVLREIDVKRRFGQSISGIDHFIEFDNICLCLQDKLLSKTITNSQVGHFITCVNNISAMTMKKCIGIFISNVDFSLVSKQQINLENSKNSNYFSIIFNSDFNQLKRDIMMYLYNNNIFMYDDSGDSMMIY